MLEQDIASPFRIIVADDDPIWLGSAARALTAEGYLVRTFSNGHDAYQFLLSERFDLVIADMHMPKMDGMALLERVRSAPFIRNIPFIITSSANDLETLRDTVLAGTDEFMPKPIDIEFLKLKAYCIIHRAKRMDILSEASYLGRFSPKYFSDILQLVSTTKRSGLMRIIRGPSLTQLWFRNGEVKFARDESVEGIQAIFNLVRASNGRFEFIDRDPLDAININKPQMFLLLEFSRKLDVYNSSRKVNLKREFAVDEEKLQQLIASKAEKFLPDVIENCKLLLAKGNTCLAEEDHVENAEAVKIKLFETLEWASLELKRLRLELKRADKESSRIKSSTFIAKQKAIKKLDLSEGIESKSSYPTVDKPAASEKSDEVPEAAKEETTGADAKQPEIEVSSQDISVQADKTKKEAQEASAESSDEQSPAIDIPGDPNKLELDGDDSASVFGENWDEFIKTVHSKIKEKLPEKIAIDLSKTIADEESKEDLGITFGKPNDKDDREKGSKKKRSFRMGSLKPKSKKSDSKRLKKVPRLIQRFPADIVEMMQVELGKSNGTLIKQSDFKRFSDTIKQDRNVFSLPISKASAILSVAYYSSSNVMTVLVAGSPLGLQKFFSTVNGVELDKQKTGFSYLVRIPADFSQVLYIVGLRFDDLDSFEAETILERGQGAVIVVPIEEDFFEISIDSLSLSMVKYQRHRVFLVSDEKNVPSRVLSQTRSYSLPPENIFSGSAFKKAELEELFDKVVASFSPVTVL